METSVLFAVVAFFVADILLIVALAHLWRTSASRPVGWWLLAHVLLLIAHAAWIPDINGDRIPALFAAASLLAPLAAVCLLRGTLLHVGRDIPRRWLVLAGSAAAVSVVLGGMGVATHLMAAPFIYCLAAGYVVTAVTILRQPYTEGLGRWLVGVGMLATALHMADYPFVRPIEGFLPWGLFINSWLELVVGVGLVVMHSEGARKRIAEHQRELSSLFERATVGIWRADADGVIVRANPAMCSMLRYPDEESLLRTRLTLLAPPVSSGVARKMMVAEDGSNVALEVATHAAVTDQTGETGDDGWEGFARDVTQEHELEKHLVLAQKMEAVARLAGGVAHDFNNLLTVITSSHELLRESVAPDLEEVLDDAQDAADRASALTRQLMALASPQPIQIKTHNVRAVVLGIEPLLRRLISESIDLTIEAEDDVAVECERSQLEQIVLNLVVNARDAIELHGTIAARIGRTSNDFGEFVKIEIEDDGCGIPPQAQARLFEPFFTTKQSGRGTGLGLATVYAVVKRIGGMITVQSEPGVGTRFVVNLPASKDRAESEARATADRPADLAGIRILLVEDQTTLRTVLARSLRRVGAEVTEACDGIEALEVPVDRIDVLVSDVVMPRMGGPALVDKLRDVRPDLPVLLMTGYANNTADEIRFEQFGLISKPFRRDTLVRAIQEAIAQHGSGPASRAG